MPNMPAQARLVTVFGGSGFVGRHLVRALVKRGWRVRVAVRRPDLAGHLQPIGAVGQIHAVQANLRYPESVRRATEGAEAVVNLVGILFESGQQGFDTVQARGARCVAEAARQSGATRLVQMSAIGAAKGARAAYADSKAAGEAFARESFPEAVIMRPSIVFGPEDNFFNQFAALARLLPALPLIGGGHTRFQPVFVGDVADAVTKAVDGEVNGGVYELGGPRVMTFREVLEYILAVTGRKRLLVPVPFPIAEIQGTILGMLPRPVLTRDQVEMLKSDNVVSAEAIQEHRTLEGLGITPIAVESVVPDYLWRFRKSGQFQTSRLA
jgi:uncharacterized protein YbjT (DUF2867 family)